MTRESQVSKLARDSYESSACSRDQWTIRCKLEQSYTDERRKNLAGKEERPRVYNAIPWLSNHYYREFSPRFES